MTRKDELRERALRFMADEHSEPSDLVELLEQVEREVWGKVAEHCHAMHNDGYTLNDVLGCGNEGDIITGASNDELRTIERWARAQQQELE